MLRCAAALVLIPSLLAAAQALPDLARERDFERAYGSRRPAQRLTAVRDLLGTVDGTAADLLAERVLAREKDEEVLLAATAGLRRLPEGPDRDPIFRALDGARGDHLSRLVQAIALMSGSRVEERLRALASSGEGRIRALALSGLVGRLSEETFDVQRRALGDPVWEARAAALDGLAARVDDLRTLPLLIDAIPRLRGRLLQDTVRALRQRTGAEMGADADLWRRWLAAHPSGKAEPDEGRGPAASICPDLGCPTGRTVYVLDLSGSMEDPVEVPAEVRRELPALSPAGPVRRIDAARALLRRSLERLRPIALHDVIVLTGRPWSVHRALVPADARSVSQTLRRIDNLSASGKTDVQAAIDLALLARPGTRAPEDGPVGTERIVIISEGFPSGGAVQQREAILERVRETYLSRRVRIDTVGVGSCDVDLLRGLADATGGCFNQVGE